MNTNYQMWLTHNAEKEKVQLPVLPESFKVSGGSNNDRVTVMGLGEIIVIQDRPALEFSWSSFFPAAAFPGVKVGSITPPLEIVERINSWKESKKPVHLIVTACGVDLYAAIEDFSYTENGGDPGTYQYDIKLKEYREIAVRQVKVDLATGKATAVNSSSTARVDNSQTPATYTTKEGDSLWLISKANYGTGSYSKTLYEINKALIGANPNDLSKELRLQLKKAGAFG